mmetsp:Transcript_22130/g.71317  ORF Transcript_22130/g.71317 Transcript_22130/m.71317 type:complete len:409 (+) Transcript_22130:1352-2578(+)
MVTHSALSRFSENTRFTWAYCVYDHQKGVSGAYGLLKPPANGRRGPEKLTVSTPSKEHIAAAAVWERTGHQTLNLLSTTTMVQTIVPPFWLNHASLANEKFIPLISTSCDVDSGAIDPYVGGSTEGWYVLSQALRTPTMPPGIAKILRDQLSSFITVSGCKRNGESWDMPRIPQRASTSAYQGNESKANYASLQLSTLCLHTSIRSSCFVLESIFRHFGDSHDAVRGWPSCESVCVAGAVFVHIHTCLAVVEATLGLRHLRPARCSPFLAAKSLSLGVQFTGHAPRGGIKYSCACTLELGDSRLHGNVVQCNHPKALGARTGSSWTACFCSSLLSVRVQVQFHAKIWLGLCLCSLLRLRGSVILQERALNRAMIYLRKAASLLGFLDNQASFRLLISLQGRLRRSRVL